MNSVIFGLLLCSPVIFCSETSFLAVFLTENASNFLENNIFRSHNHTSPFYDNTRHIYCEHSTIEFDPSSASINEYKLHYGQGQKLTLLAYAEDEHAQAILVHTIAGNDSVHSMNEYPHVTISVSNVKPYTAVYSNDLWKRFVDDQIVTITKDEYGKPRSIIINNQAGEWYGKLTSNEKYEQTDAYVKILNGITDLDGIVCINNLWKNNKCIQSN